MSAAFEAYKAALTVPAEPHTGAVAVDKRGAAWQSRPGYDAELGSTWRRLVDDHGPNGLPWAQLLATYGPVQVVHPGPDA